MALSDFVIVANQAHCILICRKEYLGQHEEWMVNIKNIKQSDSLLGQGQFGQVHKGQFKPPKEFLLRTSLNHLFLRRLR